MERCHVCGPTEEREGLVERIDALLKFRGIGGTSADPECAVPVRVLKEIRNALRTPTAASDERIRAAKMIREWMRTPDPVVTGSASQDIEVLAVTLEEALDWLRRALHHLEAPSPASELVCPECGHADYFRCGECGAEAERSPASDPTAGVDVEGLRGRGLGGFLMTSGEVRCPECHHPTPRVLSHHAGDCRFGRALAALSHQPKDEGQAPPIDPELSARVADRADRARPLVQAAENLQRRRGLPVTDQERARERAAAALEAIRDDVESVNLAALERESLTLGAEALRAAAEGQGLPEDVADAVTFVREVADVWEQEGITDGIEQLRLLADYAERAAQADPRDG